MSKNEQYYEAYLKHNHISRRGLLRSLFHPVGKSAEQAVKNPQRFAFRPPFSAKEELFLTACTGCGICVSQCERGLIQIKNQKAELDLSYASCTFCGRCATACPTLALHSAFLADTGLRPDFLASCLHASQQPCDTCQQACPQQAISSDLKVDTERCNGCGECQLSCFMGAIQLKDRFQF